MDALKELGLSCQESLLTVQPYGKVFIPLQNYRGEQINLEGGLEIGEVESLNDTVDPSPEAPLAQVPIGSKAESGRCAHVTVDNPSGLVLKVNLTCQRTC